MKEQLLCLKEELKQYKNNLDGLDIVIRNSYKEIFENPKLETEENYQQEMFTGYASIDKPHLKYFKKEILDAKFPKMKIYDY